MAFPKTPVAGVNGLSQAAGNAIAEDEKSNINWQKSSQRIGTTNGRVKFGKPASLISTGCCGLGWAVRT
jgi:hypothetical protein